MKLLTLNEWSAIDFTHIVELITSVESSNKELGKTLLQTQFTQDELLEYINKNMALVYNATKSSWHNFYENIVQLFNSIYISLSVNKLTAIPVNQLLSLPKLVQLNVSANSLTEIPDDISKLQNLKYINFNNNKIKTIDGGIFNLVNLTALELNSNRITYISPDIKNLVNLTSLSLNNNSNLVELPTSISQLTKLKTLHLKHTKIKNVNELIELLPNCEIII